MRHGARRSRALSGTADSPREDGGTRVRLSCRLYPTSPFRGEDGKVRNRERRETGKEQMVRVHYDEGVAIHIGPESCAGGREAVREALTGECAGQPLNREKVDIPGAAASRRWSLISPLLAAMPSRQGAAFVTRRQLDDARQASVARWQHELPPHGARRA